MKIQADFLDNIKILDYFAVPFKSVQVLLSPYFLPKDFDKIQREGNNLVYSYKGKKINLACEIEKKQIWYTFSDIFIKEIYGELDVKGKDVIDIGASVGDTALYFLLKGARHVYCFEPAHERLELLKQNIKQNKIEKKVTVIPRKYVGGDLGRLVKKYDLENAVLKVDCEGGEYGLLKESESTLRKLSQIEIEYHYGYKNLMNHLDSTFYVSHTLPFYFPRHKMYIGYISAYRKLD